VRQELTPPPPRLPPRQERRAFPHHPPEPSPPSRRAPVVHPPRQRHLEHVLHQIPCLLRGARAVASDAEELRIEIAERGGGGHAGESTVSATGAKRSARGSARQRRAAPGRSPAAGRPGAPGRSTRRRASG